MLAVFAQKCDNRDNLVTTFLGEVVTGLGVAVSGFARKCDNVTTSLRDTHMHTRARAHVRAQMDVTDVTSIKNNQITKTYLVTTSCFWGCHRLSRLSHRFFFQSGGFMDINSGLAWFGFWLFMAAFVACDSWVFSQGYESLLQEHKTEPEKQIQALKIEEMRARVELLKKGNI